MMNLMNLMMILCKSTSTYMYLHVLTVYLHVLLYTAPELTYLVPYHLNTPVRNMSSAHLMLLASFIGRKALDNKEGRYLRALPTVRKVLGR